MCYLAYHFRDYNKDKNLPIAASENEGDAMALAAKIVLQLGWTDGYIAIIKNPDVTLEDVIGINSAVEQFINRQKN